MRAVLSIFAVVICVAGHRNNVCSTFDDYTTRDGNSNCWYNPDVDATPDQLAKNHGYPLEIYDVETEDGFLLQTFRIPYYGRNRKGVVFMQHPLFNSATVWIDKGNDSLGFMLNSAGYDVWLGNFRGNVYTKHKIYNENDKEFWNHSIHEMAVYDLPAMLSFVQKNTNGSRMHYVSLSVGGTAAVIYASVLPDHAAKCIREFVMFSPVIFTKGSNSLLVYSGPFGNFVWKYQRITDVHYMLISRYGDFTQKFFKWLCFNYPSALRFCMSLLIWLADLGEHYNNINPAWTPILVDQNFRGFSVKTALHFRQHNLSGKFTYYDYGETKNREIYGSPIPPQYPLKAMRVPSYMIWGGIEKDTLDKEIAKLQDNLSPEVFKYGIRIIKHYTHIDFLYSKDIGEVLHKPTVKFINSVNND